MSGLGERAPVRAYGGRERPAVLLLWPSLFPVFLFRYQVGHQHGYCPKKHQMFALVFPFMFVGASRSPQIVWAGAGVCVPQGDLVCRSRWGGEEKDVSTGVVRCDRISIAHHGKADALFHFKILSVQI